MNKKAYTLIEILIVITIFIVIIILIYLAFSKGNDAVSSLDTRAQLVYNARMAMQEAIRDLSDSSRDTVTTDISGSIPFFTDPINNQTHQILIFASARGNSGVGAEDGTHQNNNYVHLDNEYEPSWRSAIIYCTYVTADGIQQLRKYVDYGSAIDYYGSQANIFPLSVVSVSSTTINLIRGDGTSLSIPRDSGIAKASYIATEDSDDSGTLEINENNGNDSMPPDNGDNVLDRGADYTFNSGLLAIKLLLAKSETSLTVGIRYVTVTLSGSTELRNE